jgi:hypothetical protein
MAFDIQPDLRARFEYTLRKPIECAEAIGGGYTPALRLRIHLRDGRSVFIKSATTGPTAKWLRQEYGVYAVLDAPFMPYMIVWDEHRSAGSTEPFRCCWTPAGRKHCGAINLSIPTFAVITFVSMENGSCSSIGPGPAWGKRHWF